MGKESSQAHADSWMYPLYTRLTKLPEWPGLSSEARAERLLEWYEAELRRAWPPRRGLFPRAVTRKEKLAEISRVMRSFESQDRE